VFVRTATFLFAHEAALASVRLIPVSLVRSSVASIVALLESVGSLVAVVFAVCIVGSLSCVLLFVRCNKELQSAN
jgi:hypothetical protein